VTPDGAFTLHHGPSIKPDSGTSSSSRKGKTFLDEFKKEVISLLDEDEDVQLLDPRPQNPFH